MHVVAHCRPGFESECAQDLARLGATPGGEDPSSPGRSVVVASLEVPAARLHAAARRAPPVFTRSWFTGPGACALGERDRIAPLLAVARSLEPPFGAIWLETPDTNEGKALSGLTRRLQPLLEDAARNASILRDEAVPSRRLHVLFTAREQAFVGTSDAATGARWPMGIPRLRMPSGAPSRSTLKLVEALVTFLGARESEVMRPAMRAVDLGAAPGGWAWQLVRRGLRVTAVDNGALRGEVADDPLVTHVRTDGLTYRPRRPVDWMVCDIVEQPARIAAVVARWIASGDARHAIFNLKLPMKKRYEETMRCRAIIEEALAAARVRHVLQLKQLYHDREEVTGYVARV